MNSLGTYMSIRQLSEHLYDIQLDFVRVFVIENIPENTVTLVDTGLAETAETLVDCLKSQFGTVDRVILTHDGADHYGGLDAIIDAFDSELYVSPSESTLVEQIDHDIDVEFEDGDILPGGIEVIQVTGHTNAPSALLLPAEDALISGDILDGADRRGLPQGYLLPPPAIFNKDHTAAERELDTLLDYNFDKVYVFHGSHVLNDAKLKLEKYIQFREHFR